MAVNGAENSGHRHQSPLIRTDGRQGSVSGRLRGYRKTVSLGRRTASERWHRLTGTSQPAETRLPSGLPRVVAGRLWPVVTVDPRGQASEQVARKAQEKGDGVERQHHSGPQSEPSRRSESSVMEWTPRVPERRANRTMRPARVCGKYRRESALTLSTSFVDIAVLSSFVFRVHLGVPGPPRAGPA